MKVCSSVAAFSVQWLQPQRQRAKAELARREGGTDCEEQTHHGSSTPHSTPLAARRVQTFSLSLLPRTTFFAHVNLWNERERERVRERRVEVAAAAAAAGRMGRRRREGPGNARGGRGLERESGSGAVRARGGPLKRRRAWPQPGGERREGGREGGREGREPPATVALGLPVCQRLRPSPCVVVSFVAS